MRIDFLAEAADRKLARQLIRRLPAGVRIGEPARIEDENGKFLGWSISHPDLDEEDSIRLHYAAEILADEDEALTKDSLNDDGRLTAEDIRAFRQRINEAPEVRDAIRAHRRAQRLLSEQ